MILMKNVLLKLRTLLVVLLIIVGVGILVWLLGIMKGLGLNAINDNSIFGTIIFAVFGLGVIFIFAYFIMRRSKLTPSEKDTIRMQKESIRQ